MPDPTLVVVLAALVAACTDPASAADPTSDQIAGYRAETNQLETVTRQYDTAIGKAAPATCIAVHRTYNLAIRPIVARIDVVDEPLDDKITARGGAAFADLDCVTQAIVKELDYHGAVACQELTIEDNRAEAARHLLALDALVEHALARVNEIETGLATKAETWTWTASSACP